MGPILHSSLRRFRFRNANLAGKAYDQALASLHDSGQPIIVREAIAARMFDLAAKGERDIHRLCRGALGPIASQELAD
jgi:hypothetical protein